MIHFSTSESGTPAIDFFNGSHLWMKGHTFNTPRCIHVLCNLCMMMYGVSGFTTISATMTLISKFQMWRIRWNMVRARSWPGAQINRSIPGLAHADSLHEMWGCCPFSGLSNIWCRCLWWKQGIRILGLDNVNGNRHCTWFHSFSCQILIPFVNSLGQVATSTDSKKCSFL